MKLSLGLAAILFIGASNAVPTTETRASNTCVTKHSGYLSVYSNTKNKAVALTLNSKDQVVYGKSGAALKVDFQACPKLSGNIAADDKWVGRIVSGGKCLTISNANSTAEPYFAKLAGCTSNTSPKYPQTWKYGTGDDRGVVFWGGRPEDPSGYVGWLSNSKNDPKVDSNGRLEIGCAHECSSFSILKTKP